MHYIIRFTTGKFDVSTERENPVNPIYGESLLLWLKDQLKGNIEISEPDAEDWGWYSFLEWDGRNYMLGSSASEEDNGQYEWILQVEKHRSFKERLFGKEEMKEDDECLLYFKNLIEHEESFVGVTVE